MSAVLHCSTDGCTSVRTGRTVEEARLSARRGGWLGPSQDKPLCSDCRRKSAASEPRAVDFLRSIVVSAKLPKDQHPVAIQMLAEWER